MIICEEGEAEYEKAFLQKNRIITYTVEDEEQLTTPDTLEVGVLDVDVPTTTTAEFTIANTGDYPLEYVFPKFSDQQLEKQTKSAHKYGYAAESNLNGSAEFAYDGNAALIGGTDITSSFSDDVYLSKEIALGFSFPFYGKAYDRVYISSFGGIAFNNGHRT